MDMQRALVTRGKPVTPSEPLTRLTEAEARSQVEATIAKYGLKAGEYYLFRIGPHYSDPYRITTFRLVRDDAKSTLLIEVSFIPA